MTYNQAIEWIEVNKKLIGTKTEDGMVFGDLVAVPVDPKDREAFLRKYVLYIHQQASAIPIASGELEVWAIDTDRIARDNVLLFKRLAG